MGLTLAEIREKRVKASEEMAAILEAVKRSERLALTDEEKISYDKAKTEYKELGDMISRLEEQEEITAELQKVIPARASGASVIVGEPAKKSFDDIGEFMGAVLQARLGRKVDQRLEYQAEQSIGSAVSGGFMVPKEFSRDIMKVDAHGAVLRSLAREFPSGESPDAELSIPALDQSATQNIYGGVSLSWTNIEANVDLAETDAKLRLVTLKPQAVAGTIAITNSLMRNWSAAGAFYGGLLQEALVHAFELAFLNGSGVAQPLGINNAANTALLTQTRATSSRVKYADLVNMEKKFRGNNPTWIFSQAALSELRLLEDTAGNPIFALDAIGGLPSTVLGYKYVINQRGAALGSQGDVMLTDMGFYGVKPGSGPFVDVSEHILFKRDRSLIRIVANIDGTPLMKDPIEIENESTTKSPFVALL